MVLVDQAVEELRAVVTIAYPMGLPEFDPVRECLDNTEDLSGSAASKEVYVADQTTLWWANKELVRGKTLADYVGRNEKTKIVAKLQKVRKCSWWHTRAWTFYYYDGPRYCVFPLA